MNCLMWTLVVEIGFSWPKCNYTKEWIATAMYLPALLLKKLLHVEFKFVNYKRENTIHLYDANIYFEKLNGNLRSLVGIVWHTKTYYKHKF